MNKKVLVLTLALIVAFAGSAMAEVKLSGKFTATMEQDNFKLFTDGYKLDPGFEFSIKGVNSSVTEGVKVVETEVVDEETGETTIVIETEEDNVTNWEFDGGIKYDQTEENFVLKDYRLGLYDDYFKAWVWGNGYELSDKGTPFGFVSVGKKADDIRARVEVPVVDLATVTLDFAKPDNMRAFVDGSVEGIDVGVAYARTNWSKEEKIKNTIAAYAKGAVSDINLKGEAGVILGEKDDLGLAFGVGADTKVTDEVKVEGSVKYQNDKWLEDATTELFGKATYEVSDLQVWGSVKQTLVKVEEDEDSKNANEINVAANYRLSTKVGYGDLFHADHWFKNDAPAAGVSAKFADLKFDNVRVDVASPVVADMVWAKAYAKYLGDKKFEAGALGYIKATDKLTVKPSLDYVNTGKVFDTKLVADYLIGQSDAKLTLTVQKVFTEDGHTDDDGNDVAKELIKAYIEVPF